MKGAMMTDQEALDFYDKLVQEYGDKLPNPEHYPETFKYFVRLYRYVEAINHREAQRASGQ